MILNGMKGGTIGETESDVVPCLQQEHGQKR